MQIILKRPWSPNLGIVKAQQSRILSQIHLVRDCIDTFNVSTFKTDNEGKEYADAVPYSRCIYQFANQSKRHNKYTIIHP